MDCMIKPYGGGGISKDEFKFIKAREKGGTCFVCWDKVKLSESCLSRYVNITSSQLGIVVKYSVVSSGTTYYGYAYITNASEISQTAGSYGDLGVKKITYDDMTLYLWTMNSAVTDNPTITASNGNSSCSISTVTASLTAITNSSVGKIAKILFR